MSEMWYDMVWLACRMNKIGFDVMWYFPILLLLNFEVDVPSVCQVGFLGFDLGTILFVES